MTYVNKKRYSKVFKGLVFFGFLGAFGKLLRFGTFPKKIIV